MHFVFMCVQARNLYGVDWDGPLPLNEEDAVIVPNTLTLLSDEDMQQLASQIDPLAVSYDFGIDLYLECLQFVVSKL